LLLFLYLLNNLSTNDDRRFDDLGSIAHYHHPAAAFTARRHVIRSAAAATAAAAETFNSVFTGNRAATFKLSDPAAATAAADAAGRSIIFRYRMSIIGAAAAATAAIKDFAAAVIAHNPVPAVAGDSCRGIAAASTGSSSAAALRGLPCIIRMNTHSSAEALSGHALATGEGNISPDKIRSAAAAAGATGFSGI
jgi:hypothetical protein